MYCVPRVWSDPMYDVAPCMEWPIVWCAPVYDVPLLYGGSCVRFALYMLCLVYVVPLCMVCPLLCSAPPLVWCVPVYVMP